MLHESGFQADASKCFGSAISPQEHQDEEVYSDIFEIVNHFCLNDLKTVFFLRMTDVHNKESLNAYIQIVAQDEDYLKSQFCKKWYDKKFRHRDLIELLGVMKKFKDLRQLGMCRHIFKEQQNMYTGIPEISKLFFMICSELDDNEVNIIRRDLFPENYNDICGEELICLMLLHEKIRPNDLRQLKQFLVRLKRHEIITMIEGYENFYPVRQPAFGNPCGLALIINQKNFRGSSFDIKIPPLEERKGSDMDCRKLQNLWQDFGFKVEMHINLSGEAIHALSENLVHRNLSIYDVFVMCIMSHGIKGCFYSSDSIPIEIDSFVDRFADRCMIGKPKLIFIQACQGDLHNEGIPVNPQRQVRKNLVTDSRPYPRMVPQHADIFKAMATIDNYVSYRDEQDGSLFVSYLVKNIDKYGETEDIEAIFTRVKNDISEENAVFNDKLCKQLPITSSTLRKKVVLKRMCRNTL